jgi:lipase chaperone LimK
MKPIYRNACISVIALFVAYGAYTYIEKPTIEAVAELSGVTNISTTAPSTLDTKVSQPSQGQEKTVTQAFLSDLVSNTITSHEEYEASVNNRPSSLQDVPLPTPLELDQNGNLLVDFKLKNLFEYYLSSLGEETIERVVLRIKLDLEHQLDDGNLDRGIELLESYLQYRNHLGILKNDYALTNPEAQFSLESVISMHNQAAEARHAFFDEEAITGFFQQEDDYNRYTLARAEVNADPNLTPEEKQVFIEDIEANAPEWLTSLNSKSKSFSTTRDTLSQLKNTGASEEEIAQVIFERYGLEAAERMSALEERRAQWSKRLAA